MDGTTKPVLSMRGIGKRYPSVVALRDVNLTIRSGEAHPLVGENGAGKSTVIKILSGAIHADAGGGGVVAFLASDAAAMIIGHAVLIDGDWTAR